MDAVTYIKEVMRMCESSDDNCEHCPAKIEKFCPISLCQTFMNDIHGNEEKAVSIVEKWAKDHPVKTRQSEFLKMFPKAKRDIDGILCISPCDIDIDCENVCESTKIDCDDCRRKYWKTDVSK